MSTKERIKLRPIQRRVFAVTDWIIQDPDGRWVMIPNGLPDAVYEDLFGIHAELSRRDSLYGVSRNSGRLATGRQSKFAVDSFRLRPSRKIPRGGLAKRRHAFAFVTSLAEELHARRDVYAAAAQRVREGRRLERVDEQIAAKVRAVRMSAGRSPL